MNRLGVIVAFALTAAVNAQGQAPAFDRSGFASDFTVLVRTLRDNHPKLKLIRERAAFDSVVQSVETRLPSYDRTDSYLGLMRVVASLEDGHTGIELASLGFRRYPVDVTVFEDGIYVTRTTAAASKALGWRLTRVGRVPIDTLVQRLRPYLTADNDMGRRQSLPPRLASHELLVGVGAADASGAWFVGTTDSIWLAAPAPGMPALTHTARDTTRPLPDFQRNRARAFWWKIVRTSPALPAMVYAQINSLAREPGISFAAFVDTVFTAIDSSDADALVIDLRNNGGGDATLSKILVQRIIRHTRINRRNHLYVLTGRTTFSAAVILAAELENQTEATFVGEPTGAPANHYGEPARMELSATKIRFAYSRLYWQNGDPRDARPWIPPRIPVPLVFTAWRDNQDPALEVILGLSGVLMPSRDRPLPKLQIAGSYPTDVMLLNDACGGTDVQSMPTTVEHTVGTTSVSLTHAGSTYTGSVRADGAFATEKKTLSVNGASYDIEINGGFTGDGFRAIVNVMSRDPRRSAPCQYMVLWTGTRTSGFNVIPGR